MRSTIYVPANSTLDKTWYWHDPATNKDKGLLSQISTSRHSGTSNYLYADGHVDTIADPDIRALYWRELQERYSAFAFPRREQQAWLNQGLVSKTEWRGSGGKPAPRRSSQADTQRHAQGTGHSATDHHRRDHAQRITCCERDRVPKRHGHLQHHGRTHMTPLGQPSGWNR